MRRVYRDLFRRSFTVWQKMGFHVTRVAWGSPIPDTRTLRNELWEKQSPLRGLDMNYSGQVEMLSLFSSQFKKDYEEFPASKPALPYKYYIGNQTFPPVDAAMLYCMIRHFKPKRIVEVGSGFSTFMSAEALLRNKQENPACDCALIAIEPYPNATLRQGFPGLSRLVVEKAQNVSLSMFTKLEENDILFIDSSHALAIGNDVAYEYLDVIPSLAKGVIVHCHDIFLPAEYPRRWILDEHMFCSEQYLLQAFLAFNKTFKVLLAGAYLHAKHPELLEAAFSRYNRKLPATGSFWMQRIS